MNYKKIGQRIREERTKLRLTREKFAEILDLSTNFLGQIERGEKKMSLETLVKISECLHVSVDYLLNGPKEKPKLEAENQLQALIEICTPKEKYLITDMIRSVLPHLKK